MKVQTNAGEVELTAEMVRPGMVFETSWWSAVVTVGVDGWTAQHIAEDPAARFLGCDPDIAARADCARYGIAPGIDAGAHGFARLRGGGAVDLRRQENVRPGMVFRSDSGKESMWDAADLSNQNWAATWREFGSRWRFVGLDAHHARPEDMRRLCCGEVGWVAGDAHQCTLAIGHDGEHEDLATGVRWGAKPGRVWSSEGTSNGFLFENDGGRLRAAKSGRDSCNARPVPGQPLVDTRGRSAGIAAPYDVQCPKNAGPHSIHGGEHLGQAGVFWVADWQPLPARRVPERWPIRQRWTPMQQRRALRAVEGA